MATEKYLSLPKVQRDVLLAVAVADGEDDNAHPHGSVIREWIGDKNGTSPYSQSLYRAIGDLEDEGLIRKIPINDRSNGLALTDDGRQALVELQRTVTTAINGDD